MMRSGNLKRGGKTKTFPTNERQVRFHGSLVLACGHLQLLPYANAGQFMKGFCNASASSTGAADVQTE
jgi:hypothetical protein